MYKTLFLVISLLFFLPLGPVYASATGVNVPDHCTAADTGGTSVSYTGHYLGICALIAAQAAGDVSAYELSYDKSFGFYLASINGITPSSTEYWALSVNGAYASDGLSSLAVAAGDVLSFQLTDWSTNTDIGSPIAFTIGSLVPSTPAPSSAPAGGGGLTLHDPFDITRAINFLWSKQDPSGTFGSTMLNDWVAIAASGGKANDMRAHLAAYYFAHPPALTSTTDFERHAMALEALGVDPYEGPTDYIAPIIAAFDGAQIGDPAQDNDDIFALFPLLHAGYTPSDALIEQTTAFILSRQHADGSWDSSIDMTAAAVQALVLVPHLPGATIASEKAQAYLHAAQASDGSFGDPSATSWVLQAAAALGQSPVDWSAGSYHLPDYYLATMQELDGGIGPVGDDVQKRVWETAYAIPAIEHKSWDALLASFPKATSTPSAGAVASLDASTTATSASASGGGAAAAEAAAAPRPATRAAAVPAGFITHVDVAPHTAHASSTSPTAPAATSQAGAAAASLGTDWVHYVLSAFFPWFF